MGRKPKPEYELPEEIKIVLACSPILQPCAKFRRANIYRFTDHMKNDKCQQCIEFIVQAEKELKTIQLLAAWRKSRNNRGLHRLWKGEILGGRGPRFAL